MWNGCVDSHPFWPGLGALLLNVRVCLCLNLGGPFLGVVGPAVPAGVARALPAGGAPMNPIRKRDSELLWCWPESL
uniref:Secreted protein n=1 Tax=Salmo trutta TaxID=8032 RepID=A0A674BZ14_SALTR